MVKMMGQKLEQQWSVRKQSGDMRPTRLMESLLRDITVPLEARVAGGSLTVRDVLDLAPNDILSLGTPVTRPTEVLVSGVTKFSARVVTAGRRRAVQVLGDEGDPNGATRT
jgi:flagellar motor switch protein FliM